jgi:hypothetical protein
VFQAERGCVQPLYLLPIVSLVADAENEPSIEQLGGRQSHEATPGEETILERRNCAPESRSLAGFRKAQVGMDFVSFGRPLRRVVRCVRGSRAVLVVCSCVHVGSGHMVLGR